MAKKKRSTGKARPPSSTAPRPTAPESPPAPRREFVGRVWWAALAGCLTFVAFPFRSVPDSGIWPLGWVCLVPLLWSLRGTTWRQALRLGWVTGTVTNFGGYWWITEVLREFGHLPSAVAWGISLLHAVYQGLQWGIFAALVARLGRPGPWLVAAVYTAVEYLFPAIFPAYLGNCQYPFLAAVQVADLFGVSGVTFTLVLGNAVVGVAIDRRAAGDPMPRARLALAVATIAAVLAYGAVRIAQVDDDIAAAEHLKIGMVEANIGIWEKQAKGLEPDKQVPTLHKNLLLHQVGSAELAGLGAELILWPESSYFPVGEVYGKRLDAFVIGVGAAPRAALWRDIRRADGFAWTAGPTVGGPLHAVAASREDTAVAVGSAGRVVRFEAGTQVASPVAVDWVAGAAPPALYGVAVRERRGLGRARDGAAVEIWAVGAGGALLHGTVAGLRAVASGTEATLRGVALATSDRGIAVGDGGVVLALAPEGAREIPAGVSEDLSAVHADPDGRGFWAVGASGRVLQVDQVAWAVEDSATGQTLRALTGASGSALWAVGDRGTVQRRTPAGEWVLERFPKAVDLIGVVADPRGLVIACDRAGGLWRRGADAAWTAMDAPGLGPVHALAALSWVRMMPIPRDARYLRQSSAPLPDPQAFLDNPEIEWRLPLRDRTAVQRAFTTPVLFGALTWEPRPDGDETYPRTLYNSAVLLDEMGRVVGIYDKVYLLVFGEYIPFGETFPWLYDLIPEAGRFVPGTDVQTFDDGTHRYGVMVCYEDILPAFSGALAAQDPDVILNVTNDAWFGRTGEPYLHLALAMMRTVETRRAMLRSTNTGVSAVVDPAGRLLQQSDLDEPEVLLASVPMMSGMTVYARIGDLFAYAMILWSAAALLLAARRRTGATPTRGPSRGA